MGPVDQAAAVIPNVFSEEIDGIADCESCDSWGFGNVMNNQKRMATFQVDDESLVFCTCGIIRKDFFDHARTFDGDFIEVVLERIGNRFVGSWR